jgi:hypothetical protein
MNKSFKVMAISVITALVLALPLAAQNPPATAPASGPVSNQRTATAEIYSADVDRYLNVNNWSAVNFDKWFGFAHGSDVGSPAFRANLGYATKLGDIYLGARYFGNIFADTGSAESVTLNPAYDADTQELTSLTETTSYPANKLHNSVNQLDILIGVAGQGIKVGFFESMSIRPTAGNRNFSKTTNYLTGVEQYTYEPVEYTAFAGYLLPSIQWGTVLNVNDLTIKPRVTLSFNIYQDTIIDTYQSYTTVYGDTVGNQTLTRASGQNNGFLRPGVAVGADIGLPKKDDVATTFAIDYTLNIDFYNNDYSGSGFSGTAAGPVSWDGNTTTTTSSIASKTETTTANTLRFSDNTRFYHSISPKVTFDKTVADGLKLGLAVLAPVTITATSNDRYTEARSIIETTNFNALNSAAAKTITETTVHTPLGLTEQTVFTLSPSVRIGASYNLIPSRFTVNDGVRLNPFAWSYTSATQSRNGDSVRTTVTTKNGDGVVTDKSDTTALPLPGGTNPPTAANAYNDVSTITSAWTPFTGGVLGGFVFNFNENIALDLLASVGGFDINLTTVNVLFTFKF